MINFEFISVDGRKKMPLNRQIYKEIRDAILSGRLTEGSRLPSSRNLTEQIGVSRTTILAAIEQLIAEGFLQTRKGSGTFVCSDIPHDRTTFNIPTGHRSPKTVSTQYQQPNWSPLAERVLPFGNPYSNEAKPFRHGVPALDSFPFAEWAQVWRKGWKQFSSNELSYRNPCGCMDLRQRVSEYLAASRGVRCRPEQVLLVGGSIQALDLISRLMLVPGDHVYVENPGFVSARQVFETNGAILKPLVVDDHGAVLPARASHSKRDRLIALTPSHQFPLGVTMSIDRRLEWLEWAENNDCLIVEDDYDSEFRYEQNPFPALQGLDEFSRTIYIGSFSKVVFPALGMAYVVVPERMLDRFERLSSVVSRPPSAVDQMVLAGFIEDGHFIRHVRRMRRTHRQRRDMLVQQIERTLSDKVELMGTNAGLHCVARTIGTHHQSDVQVSRRLANEGLFADALSPYFLTGTREKDVIQGFILGFASFRPGQIQYADNKLQKLL